MEKRRERIARLFAERESDRFFVYRPENIAWLTGGGDCTVVAQESVAWLEVDRRGMRLHTSRVEAARLRDEEGMDLEMTVHPWHDRAPVQRPNDLEEDLTPLRLVLCKEEQERFRLLGRDAAVALGDALRAAQPDWSERFLAGRIAAGLHETGIRPVVLLVAGEERLFEYRHPLPKDKPLGAVAMGVVCGQRDGLIADLTRIRAWNPARIASLHAAVLRVEAAALDASVPGAELGEILSTIQAAYRENGFPQAFEEHHQGGIAGYRTREVLAVPRDKTRLEAGMCVAWNPSLPGAKSEDTFLVTAEGLENLTVDPDWPTVNANGRARPALLTDPPAVAAGHP